MTQSPLSLFPSRRFIMLAFYQLQLSIWNECPLQFLPCEDLGFQCHLGFCPLGWRGVGHWCPHKHSHTLPHVAFPLLCISAIHNTNNNYIKIPKKHKIHPQCTSVASSNYPIQYLSKSVSVVRFMSISLTIERRRNILWHAINDSMMSAVSLTDTKVKIYISPQF